MQLEAWTQLSGLTHLRLRGNGVSSRHHTLVAVLVRLTTLRSLMLPGWWGLAAGGHSICCPTVSSRE